MCIKTKEDEMKEILKVSAKSKVNSVAGAIAATIKEKDKVEIRAIGAGAINQAVKAIAVARRFVASNGINLVCVPGFTEVKNEENIKTAITLVVRKSL